MIIIYKIENQCRIKIFDLNFIKNNIYKCKIIIGNKEQDITEYLIVNKNIKNLEIKLKEKKQLLI